MGIRKLSNRNTSGWMINQKSIKDAKLLPLVFEFSSFGDTNGLFWYLGKLNTGIWSNPHTSGQIRVIVQTISTGTPQQIVDRTSGTAWNTSNASNSFVVFDIGQNRKFNLKNITIRHDSQNGWFLRNFKIRGSNNVVTLANPPYTIQSATWTDLATFTNNTNISSPNQWGNFVIPAHTEKYRWIQIYLNGTDANGSSYLMVRQAELYGNMLIE